VLSFQKFVFKSVALIIALGIPIFIIYDYYFPWEIAQGPIAERVNCCVAVAVSFEIEGDRIQYTYALFPRSFELPRLLTIEAIRSTRTRTSEEPLGFWLILAVFIYGWYLILRFFCKLFHLVNARK
jgi:hypothetical protein